MAEFLESPESDQAPQLGSHVPTIAGGITELSIRLWSIASADVSWSSEHAAICLIEDLVKASGGRLVPESSGTLAAHFDGNEQAVVAARRMQKALCVFSKGPETAGFAASIVVHKLEDQLRSEPSFSPTDLLWSHSMPGEILISGTIHEKLQFVPGLNFRAVSAESGAPQNAYQELLWAAPEVLKDWQDRVSLAPATLPSTEEPQPTDPTSADLKPTQDVLDEDVPPVSWKDEHEISAREGLIRSSRWIWIAAGVLVLGLVAVLFKVTHVSQRTTQPTRPQQTQNPKSAEPATGESQVPESATKVAEGQPSTTSEPESPKPVEARTPAKTRRAAREQKVPVAEYEGFTAKQVPQLVRRADQDAGNGNYDEAKREYEIVLKLQPENAAAREGLRKLGLKIGGRR